MSRPTSTASRVDDPSGLRISPTEPATVRSEIIRLLGHDGHVRSDWTPEDHGVDYMWIDAHGYWRGVQRKEVRDFIASLNDGRLAKEIAQMVADIAMPVLIVEGQLRFAGNDLDAPVVTDWGGTSNITRGSWQRRLLSIMDRGIQIMWSRGMSDTAAQVVEYWRWSQQGEHSTGTTRPGPALDWGKATNRDWQVHLLCGLDGVGPKLANRILDQLGYCPIQVSATREELMSVGGIGKKLADKILSVNMVSGGVQVGADADADAGGER